MRPISDHDDRPHLGDAKRRISDPHCVRMQFGRLSFVAELGNKKRHSASYDPIIGGLPYRKPIGNHTSLRTHRT